MYNVTITILFYVIRLLNIVNKYKSILVNLECLMFMFSLFLIIVKHW